MFTYRTTPTERFFMCLLSNFWLLFDYVMKIWRGVKKIRLYSGLIPPPNPPRPIYGTATIIRTWLHLLFCTGLVGPERWFPALNTSFMTDFIVWRVVLPLWEHRSFFIQQLAGHNQQNQHNQQNSQDVYKILAYILKERLGRGYSSIQSWSLPPALLFLFWPKLHFTHFTPRVSFHTLHVTFLLYWRQS